MKKIIDYYIYIDYSENLVGYNIIEKKNIPLILPKVIKFRHYKEERHKRTYLIKIRREIKCQKFSTGLKLVAESKSISDYGKFLSMLKNHPDEVNGNNIPSIYSGWFLTNLDLDSLILKQKIKPLKDNLLVFADIIEFVKEHDNCIIFASVDNNQFNAFTRLLNIIPHKDHITIVKESELKKESVEYKLSLIIDTKLNLERTSK